MKEELKIVIAGDICPTDDTKSFFDDNNYKALFNDLLPLFSDANILMANLEFPLVDEVEKVNKTGPILTGKTKFIEPLVKAGFNVFGLANNHIKDAGASGVNSTLNCCTKFNIDTVGAGANLATAKKPLIIEKNGWKIGLIAFAEQEFNTATENEAGANYIDVYEDFDTIKKLKEKTDYVIVLYHGGVEYYEYPSPLLQKKCRKMIASGADIVTCQHSHCIGTVESYNDGTIVYGQGNTLFGYRKNSETWNHGLLLQINLNEEGIETSYIPIETINNGTIQKMNNIEGNLLMTNLFKISKKISDETFIQNSWLSFCNKRKPLYFSYMFGFGYLFIVLNRLLNNQLVNLFYSDTVKKRSYNIIRCESHYEVIRTLFKTTNR